MDDEEDDVMDEDVKVIAVADPASQTSLEFEAVPDVMEQEQTWPDDSELKEAEGILILTKPNLLKGLYLNYVQTRMEQNRMEPN